MRRHVASSAAFLALVVALAGVAVAPAPASYVGPPRAHRGVAFPGLRYRAQGTIAFPVPAWVGTPCQRVTDCRRVLGLRAPICRVPDGEVEQACLYFPVR